MALQEVKENGAVGSEKSSVEEEEEEIEPFPEPAKQQRIISAIDADCTCTYAVSKMWHNKWEEFVGGGPGEAEHPGPVEMDSHNDGNNDYVNEEIWKRLVRWYGISPSHQLDRKHMYFKDEKMFDICILSPYSGIVEHNIKKFNRFEEIGYIECQLRKIFHIPESRSTRLWISEKAQVPRFRQLLLRFRMLNDCIHRDKVYILALEECNGNDTWPTGEPGEPKGDLTKYKDLTTGQKEDQFWNKEITQSLDTLQLAVSHMIKESVDSFMQNSLSLMHEKEETLDATQKVMEHKLEELEAKENFLDEKSKAFAKDDEKLKLKREVHEKEEKDFQEQKQKFDEELKQMETLHTIQENKIKLDIGGQIYTTSLQTLKRDADSMLAAMFSGRYELKKEADNSYFIDRDGTYFRYILNFLRDGYIDEGTLPNETNVVKELLREAKYYKLGSLVIYLEKLLPNGENKT